tara:strand:- start:1327 stop:1527 length:201 start_codon:yes stop_codon:yes gene_type:complete
MKNDSIYGEEKVSIPLRVSCRTKLNQVQQHLNKTLGFSITQNQVIQHLINKYIKENMENKEHGAAQ